MSKHHLDLGLSELLITGLVFFIFNLLFPALDLDVFVLFVFGLAIVLWLLQDSNLVTKLLKVLLLDDLVQVLFGERERFWMLLVLILKILQK